MEDGFGVMVSEVGGVIGFGSALVGFAPVGFEVSGGGLVVGVVDEVGEDGVEGVGFVGEGDVGLTGLAVAGAAVGEEEDGDEVAEVWLVVMIFDEGGDFGGEGEGGWDTAAAGLLGLAEGAGWFTVAAEDVLDGVLRTVVLLTEADAAFVIAVVLADDIQFSMNVEVTLVVGFDARFGLVALMLYGTISTIIRITFEHNTQSTI